MCVCTERELKRGRFYSHHHSSLSPIFFLFFFSLVINNFCPFFSLSLQPGNFEWRVCIYYMIKYCLMVWRQPTTAAAASHLATYPSSFFFNSRNMLPHDFSSHKKSTWAVGIFLSFFFLILPANPDTSFNRKNTRTIIKYINSKGAAI